MNYKTIKEFASDSFVEKKSEFIGSIMPVENMQQVNEFIAKIKAENRKARHNVYAYIIREQNASGYSDDGEPAGTGGMPMLKVLQGNGLTDVCCVVTRYFGGVLLGTGGLTRAYTEGCRIAVEKATPKFMFDCKQIDLTIDYPLYGKIERIFPDFEVKIIDSQFADKIKIMALVKLEFAEKLIQNLTDATNGNLNLDISKPLNAEF